MTASRFAFTALVLAARAVAAGPLTLEDCVAAARQNSPAIAALQARSLAAASAVKKDQGSLWPTLSLTDEQSYSRFGPDAGLSDGGDNRATAELGLDLQRLVAPPSRLSAVETQKSRIRLAQAQGQLRREVSRLFNKAAVLQRKAAEQAQAGAYVDSHIHDIERLEASGLDVSLDLLRARSQRKALGLAANSREADFLDTVGALRSVTGLAIEPEDLPADLDLGPAGPAGSAPGGLAASLLKTLPTRLAALDVAAAEAAYGASGRFQAPSLRAGLEHSFLAADPSTPSDRAYGSVTLDAFDGGQKRHESEQLRQALDAERKDRQEQDRLLRLYAEQLLVDIAHARTAYAISADIAKDTLHGMDIAKAYYRQGKIKESELLSVFADYLSAKEQRDEALLNALDKEAEWAALWEGAAP